MDNFILWHVSFSEANAELCFFADRVQHQRINQGTREMLMEMLEDLRLPPVDIKSWQIDFFRSNYLMDYPLADHWKEVWGETWRVKVKLGQSINLKIEEKELIRSYARDKSWEGESADFPSHCFIIADFYDTYYFKIAEKYLNDVMRYLPQNLSLSDFLGHFDSEDHPILEEVYNTYPFFSQQQSLTSSMSLEINPHFPRQIIVHLGEIYEGYFEEGADFSECLSDLIRTLDGTLTWDEKVIRWYS